MRSIQKIRKSFGGKLVGNIFMKTIVCKTMLIFPDVIKDYITHHVWFFSSSEDSWAYTFDGNDLKDRHFIFLSDELFREDKSQIQYTIAHEIGHVILKHKNSIGRRQTQTEIKIQERQADQFAHKYLG